MTAILETRKTPDLILPPEKPQVITGLAALIIDANTFHIRAGREKKEKASTERQIGEFSVPIDTRKKEIEGPEGNLFGALAETFDDYDVHGRDIRRVLGKSLLHMEGNTYHPGFKRIIGERTIQCEYAVVLYDGPRLHVEAFDSDEVEDTQWVPLDRLLKQDVRSLAGHAVWHALSNNVIQENLRRYHQEPQSRRRLLPPGFSIRDTYRVREMHPDMGK